MTRITHTLLLMALFVSALTPLASARIIDPDNPPMGTFSDTWLLVRMNGEDAGWTHSVMTREGDIMISRTEMTITLRRGGVSVDTEVSSEVRETVAGVPKSFVTEMKMGQHQTRMNGTIANGKVHYTMGQEGLPNATSMTIAYPEGAKMAWGIYSEQLRRGFKPGTTFTEKLYDPTVSADQGVEVEVVVGGREKVQLLDSTEEEGIRVLQTMKTAMGEIPTTSWCRDDGTIIRATVPFAGMGTIEMILGDEKSVKGLQKGGAEAFMQTLITVEKPINRKAAKSIDYRIKIKKVDDGKLPVLPKTEMQTPGKWKENVLPLTVTRIDHDALKGARPCEVTPELKEYLDPNVWINGDDPNVRKLAKKAAQGKTQPWEVCDLLRKFVTKEIKEKNMEVGFASASETARRMEGDCSEHAVLLAAMGRALGIPSRVACGIVYVPTFNETQKVFGFHMWTQFYIDGKWIDFDAAQRETDCNPTHIAFAVSSLKDSAMGTLAFPLLKVIGNIEIEVVDEKQ